MDSLGYHHNLALTFATSETFRVSQCKACIKVSHHNIAWDRDMTADLSLSRLGVQKTVVQFNNRQCQATANHSVVHNTLASHRSKSLVREIREWNPKWESLPDHQLQSLQPTHRFRDRRWG